MKLYVNEKLFSIHRKFYVKNEKDEDVYEISSKIISIGDKTTISSINGEKIAYVEQELFHLTPHYKIYIKDQYVCKISKKLQLFKNDYLLDNGYRVEGNFLMLDFVVYDAADNKIGSIKKKFISIGDKYEIDILDKSKTEIVLAIVVAIANDVNRNQRNSNNNSD